MEHQDRNKVYIYQKHKKEKQSEYGYFRGIVEFFITHRGNIIDRRRTMKETQERLEELRENEWTT